MKRLALALALVGSAHAECYYQSVYVNELKSQIERTADEQRFVGVMNDVKFCRVAFRIQVKGEWLTAQGEARGPLTSNDNQLCAQAVDSGRARVLEKIGAKMSVTQDMLCTDRDTPTVTRIPVKVGDIVKDSQMDPHPDPSKRVSFLDEKSGVECRYFGEAMPTVGGGVVSYYGTMCRVRNGDWLIRNKWRYGVDR